MILVLLGPPGSGKGTQAKQLSSERGWPQLSTGDILRSAIKAGTSTGVKAKRFMDQGALVPDEVVIDVIEDRIRQSDCKAGFILDGFPRTIPQAIALDQMLEKAGRKIALAILFSLPEVILVNRMTGRRVCSKCGSMYHVETQKPKKEGSCDSCGGPLIQRDDDKVEVIQNRLKVYHQQTEPLVDYYRKMKVLKSVSAEQNPVDVARQLSERVSGK